MEKVIPEARRRRPWYWSLRLVQFAMLAFVLIYAGFGSYLYLTQGSQLYPIQATGGLVTREEAVRRAAAKGLVPWDQVTTGSAAPQGYVSNHFHDLAPRGTIVVFHGNGGWAANQKIYVEAFRQRGFRTFLYEYPGYGGRPGKPSEAAIVPDGRALIRSLARAGYGPIYVWGESLGAGVASAVVADPQLPVHGLCLLAPWDTLAGVALHRYPFFAVRWLLKDTYDSTGNLAHFRGPICVVRGTRDWIIPPALTLNLYQHLGEPKKMIVQQGFGHENWSFDLTQPWWDEALNFIAPEK
jgi:alpha-beta hydrolase superfamily lysophospholipase